MNCATRLGCNVTCVVLLLSLLTLDVCGQTPPNLPPLQYQRWSGEINVPDPVALSVDDQGRVYVTQTRRRKLQDLDIRKNQDWIADDLGFRSVNDKRQFYRTRLAIGGDDAEQKKHVEDVNEDGHHDWRDLTVISERIFRVVDTDADGTADQISTFAEGFNTEVTGIAAGVLAHTGDVWATIAPDVWKLRDHDNDGQADSREVMATGFGLHIAYAGHDMHGLTIGPDGKVYWSIGDKGISVKTKDGRQYSYPNEGGVMRCNPDGTEFEVFAHGLRNVQEFAFDQYGNVFGVDNDADQPGERERFVCIVDGMDAGWRCHYQYRGDKYNAWTDEKLWQLPGKDHPAYIVPAIDHYMDGPAGFKFNPGTALSREWRDFFFVTNAPRGHQYAFRVQPDGDSYKMVDAHEIGSGYAIVGLAFGPDGGLYGADWDGGYPLDEKGAVIRIDVRVDAKDLEAREETQALLAQGFDQRADDELVGLLDHADMRVRLQAQFTLVDRGKTNILQAVLDSDNTSKLGKLHCVWGLGQLARKGDQNAWESIAGELDSADKHVRAQAAKTIGEVPRDGERDDEVAGLLIAMLSDANLHARVNAGLAIARLSIPQAVEPLLNQASQLGRDQHYLRHSIVRALAESADSDVLASQANHENEMRRMVCVLALRQQSSELVANYVNDSSDWVASDVARAIHDDNSIPTVLPALANGIDVAGQRSAAFAFRVINANFRIGTEQAAARLLQVASDESQPVKYRVEACEALADWLEPPVLDRVEGIRRDLAVDSRSIDRDKAKQVFAKLVENADTPIRVAAVVAARKLELALPRPALVALVDNDSVPMSLRVQALNSIAKDVNADTLEHLNKTARSKDESLSVRAVELIAKDYADKAFDTLRHTLATSKHRSVQQASISGLARVGSSEANAQLQRLAEEVLAGGVSPTLRLDVASALKKQKGLADLSKRVDKLRDERAKELGLGDDPKSTVFAYSDRGGDPANGKRVFETHLQAQCSRCHRIGKLGSKIGPELTKIASKRDPAYLLRSIVKPSADIEKKYFTQAILLDTGKVLRGVVKREDDDITVLIDSSGKEIEIATDEIEAVNDQKVSLMPDMTEVLTPAEVRDLVAYLGTLK